MPNNDLQSDLTAQLTQDFPQFMFKPDATCRWSPAEKTIYFEASNDADLLHELGHAILGHDGFSQDVELLHIERDAWEKACELAPKYGVEIDGDTVEDALDSYRDWLHERSLCPQCHQVGVQSAKTGEYSCINCETHWTANDARTCRLRRQIV